MEKSQSNHFVSIPLSNGGFALIDKADEAVVRQFKTWRRRDEKHTSYAFNNLRLKSFNGVKGKQKYTLMHRLILGLTDPEVHVDHKNHNGLDNRRENIWACTRLENMQNPKKPRVKKSLTQERKEG